jgi:hypothetical protein
MNSPKAVVPGVGPDAPIVTLPNGAQQSAPVARMDLFPPLAALHVGGVLAEGAKKYKEGNWLGIPVKSHVNKILIHALAWLAGDEQDDHLGHMACRAMMALERHLLDKQEALCEKASKS